jgi:hypothetical protein
MGDSAAQTQNVTISASANSDPTCPSTFNTSAKPGQQRAITPTCSDADADPLHFAKQSEPAHGTLTSNDGVLRYTATAGYTGPDSFTYRAGDDFGGQSAVSTVAITVSNTNTAPTCATGPFGYTVAAGAQLLLPAAPCSDADGDALTIEIPTQPAHGTLTANPDGTGTYTPNAGYTGPDSFQFRAFDGTARSASGTVNITVTASPNQAPVCQPVAKKVAPSVNTTVNLSCSDPNGDAIALEKVAGPSHGTLGAIDQGTDSVVYTPAAGYTGPDSFTYRASDGAAQSAPATVSITVTHAPTCAPVSASTPGGTAVQVTLSCTDADGDALTLSKVTDPAHGTLGAFAAGKVTYTPAADYKGPDSFTYRASDGTAESAPATAAITVTNSTPACAAKSAETAFETAVEVVLSCTDADGDAVTLSIVAPPGHGTLGAISAGTVTYTPAAGFSGADSFTYRATDGTAQSAPETVSLTVRPKPSDPGTGTGGGGGNPPPPPPPPPVDTKAPSASAALAKAQKLAAALAKGLGLAITLDEAATVKVTLTVDKATARKLKLDPKAKKAVVVGTLTKSLSAGRSAVTVKLTAKARKALKKAKSVKLGVLLSAKDAAGNTGAKTAGVTLKR